MMASNKEKYRALCQTDDSIPVFLKDWWLDAVCGDQYWDVAIVEEGNSIKAAYPYRKSTRMGLTMLNMPALTSGWGPWVKYPSDQKYASRLSYEHQITSELIEQLPAFDYFNHRFRYDTVNGLPFFWKGFSLTTRYTYVIEDLTNLTSVWDNLNSSARSQIRKAEKVVSIVETEDVSELYRFSELIFKRQDNRIPYTFEFLKRLDAACAQHQSRKILIAKDPDGRIHAALYLTWDKQSAYYLAGGIDPEASGGVFSLLMWKAIEHASKVTQKFNFEGSMIEPVERFFRSFGPKQLAYLQVQKINSSLLRIGNSFGFF